MVASATRLKSQRAAAAAVLGSEVPRIWTPPLRELNESTSLGFAAIYFAEEVCGIQLFPWQRWLLIHALELAGDLEVTYDDDGGIIIPEPGPLEPLFRFRRVLVLVARQNGKSTLSQILALFFLYVLGVDLVLGTAQDLDTAEEVWDGALDIIDDTPALAALAVAPIKVNGKKTIRLRSGERYKVKAAKRRAGRGLSGDLIMLDELREHQTFDAWAAITKTTQARPQAMVWGFSNAGDASSIVLRTLRAMAHDALGDPDGINAEEQASLAPDDDEAAELSDVVNEDLEPGEVPVALTADDLAGDPQTLGIFEYSAPPGCAVDDIDGIRFANPSLGYGIALATILGDAYTEGKKAATEWIYRTEVLCQWREGAMLGPFPPGSWEKTTLDPLEPDFAVRGKLTSAKRDVCVHVSYDRKRAYIAAAGENADGETLVTVVAAQLGVDWVKPWLVREHQAGLIRAVCGQGRGAWVSTMLEEWEKDKRFLVPIVKWQGQDLVGAHGDASDALRDESVVHIPQPAPDLAAVLAETKDLAGGWVLDDRKSKCDTAALTAWIGALWLHRRPKKSLPPPPLMPAPLRAPKIPIKAAQVRTEDLGSIEF